MSNKRNGKINESNIDSPNETVGGNGIPSDESRKPTGTETEEQIVKIAKRLLVLENRCFVALNDCDTVSDELKQLYNGKGYRSLSTSSIESKYDDYKQGIYTAYDFVCMIEKLMDEIIDQLFDFFDFFLAGTLSYNNQKEDYDYERS